MACPDSNLRNDCHPFLRIGSAELIQYFRIFGEAAFVMFREDELSIHLDVEDSTSTSD
jgi:hypothetical protein